MGGAADGWHIRVVDADAAAHRHDTGTHHFDDAKWAQFLNELLNHMDGGRNFQDRDEGADVDDARGDNAHKFV